MSVTQYLASLPNTKTVIALRDISFFTEGFIGWVVLDYKDRPVNVVNEQLMEQVQQVLAEVEKAIERREVYVVVMASGKKESFVAGADIHAMYPVTDENLSTTASRAGQAIFTRIEKLPVPTLAAINGAALGAGLELALSCTYRVAADNKKVTIGLPEVKLGLLPGAGGTVRLPRLIGLQKALQIILPGGAVRAKKALALGLVDKVLPYADLRPGDHRFYSAVRHFAVTSCLDKPAQRKLPDRLKTGEIKDRILDGTSLGRQLVARMAAKNLDKQARGLYPAPYLALESAVKGLDAPTIAQAMDIEAKGFGRLGVSPQSKALMSLFFLTEESKKRGERTNHAKPYLVKKIGIIGAGVMGAQIAAIAASKRFQVYMRDIKDEVAQKGMQHVRDHFEGKAKKGRMSAEQAKSFINLVKAGTDIKPFAQCDLIIEAAVEQMNLKKRILAEVEAVTGDKCLFATNTSSLSINELAAGSKRPKNVVGLHFFNPVAKMPLVEVIRGKDTSDEAVATSYQLALDLGKIPVVCGDGPGFIVNRILGIYMNEAAHLATEGNELEAVDKALLDFGMPMGPFRLMDEVGLDVAAHVGPILEAGLGERYKQIPEYSKVLHDNPTQLGVKTGRGFYEYKNGKKQGYNDVLMSQLQAIVLRKNGGKMGKGSAVADVVDRCVLLMVNEAAYILNEGIAKRPEDLDLAMVMGTGFAPYFGGVLSYADQRGIDKIVARLSELEGKLGGRFKPHPLLISMAKDKQRFFPKRPDPAQLKPIRELPFSQIKLKSKL